MKKTFGKKLTLNKSEISNLSNVDMKNIQGGTASVYPQCGPSFSHAGTCGSVPASQWGGPMMCR